VAKVVLETEEDQEAVPVKITTNNTNLKPQPLGNIKTKAVNMINLIKSEINIRKGTETTNKEAKETTVMIGAEINISSMISKMLSSKIRRLLRSSR
jgi:hypothetical protein